MERLLILKRLGQRAYLMRDNKVRGRGKDEKKFNFLANWSNCMGAMQKMDIYDYRNYYENRSKK